MANAYTNLGLNLNAQGKYKEAEPLIRKALAINQRVLGEDHPETANSYNNLALNLENQDKHAEAEGFYRHELVIYLRVLGEDHSRTAGCYKNLGFEPSGPGQVCRGRVAFPEGTRDQPQYPG